MSVTSNKIYITNNISNQGYTFNLYTTRSDAIKNNTDSNTDCLKVDINGQILFAATNNRSDYPETTIFKVNLRYIHKDTIKTVYYDPDSPNSYHDDYRTYTKQRNVTFYTTDNVNNWGELNNILIHTQMFREILINIQ